MFRDGKVTEAIAKYTEALVKAPTTAGLYNNRCACYIQKEMWEEAIDDAEKAIELDKTLQKAHYRRAVALRHLGDLREARSAIRLAVTYNGKGGMSDDVRKELETIQKCIVEGNPTARKRKKAKKDAAPPKPKPESDEDTERPEGDSEGEDPDGAEAPEGEEPPKKKKKKIRCEVTTLANLADLLGPGETLL